MAEVMDALILDFVEWIAHTPRSYEDVLDAWRTSCPRLTVWEDARDNGYVAREAVAGSRGRVVVTARGLALLHKSGRGLQARPQAPKSSGHRQSPR